MPKLPKERDMQHTRVDEKAETLDSDSESDSSEEEPDSDSDVEVIVSEKAEEPVREST